MEIQQHYIRNNYAEYHFVQIKNVFCDRIENVWWSSVAHIYRESNFYYFSTELFQDLSQMQEAWLSESE